MVKNLYDNKLKIAMLICAGFLLVLWLLAKIGMVWVLCLLLPFALLRVVLIATRMSELVKYTLILVWIIFAAISARVFLMEVFVVPSNSMENELRVGDKLIVNKLSYGPKLPMSTVDIPWINEIFQITGHTWSISDTYIRLKGYGSVKRHELMVFHSSAGKSKYNVKRCLGLPGDKLYIKDGYIYVNDILVEQAPTVKNKFRVSWTKDKSNIIGLFISENIVWNIVEDNDNKTVVLCKMTDSQKQALLKEVNKKKISLTIEMISHLLPYLTHQLGWNSNNFGPILIPKIGMEINPKEDLSVEAKNLIVYLNATKGDIAIKIKGTNKIIFKNDCYFMLGDNRWESLDSRYCRLVTEKDIVGKVVMSF